MRYISYFVLTAIAVVVLLSMTSLDSRADKKHADKKVDEKSKPLSALIVSMHPSDNTAIRVMDAKQLTALEAFFSNYRNRPASNRAAAWEGKYEVYFNFPYGKTIRVTVSENANARYWSVGRGDFETKGDFNKFVAALRS